MRSIPAVLALFLIACKPVSKAEAALSDAGGALLPASSNISQPVPATGIDEPKSKKKGDGVSVLYVGGSRTGKSAILAFAVDNESDEEKPISSALSFQATMPSGLSGELDTIKSKCDGLAPPHGRFACVLKYDYASPPDELRVRAEGAWFRVKLAPADGG